ncbi:hypothetical protein TESG_08219 [Trichophyton tonsurans CBS 112818]|uniref:Uncharacterized protein n=2 Tax=Trichophyton TaxID=5550 RepID=F2Q3C1_TRIEC|nr:hypothetical protein TESG_08219 [Trichophyton tonsurans CBS 112818]EGE08639.1 hypothetical protein TEQG_07601 [Trichophyton equinum CBS 127.97]EZF31959.1 hypothetical protein H101_04448 [Trichophyton interdigitale H6]
MDLDSPTSPNNPPNVEEEAYEIAPRAPVPGQPYRTQDLHPRFVYAEELNEPTESRERRHAALGVLDDLEMLMFHAVSNNESIPQTRQRFIHSLARRPADKPPLRKYVVHDLRAGRLLQAHKSDAVGASLTGMSIPKSMPGRRWMDDGRSLGGTSETTVRTDTPIVDIVEVNGGWRNEEIPSGGTVAATSMSMGVSGNVTGSSSGSTRKGKGKA